MPELRRRVLIIDDEASFRRTADDVLRARGHVVVGEASNGADARELVQRVAPDVAVLDVRLGDECGFALAQVLTRVRPQLRVLLVAADGVPETEQVLASGARGVVCRSEFARADLARLWD